MPNNYVRADSKNMTKTNPVSTKAKANDLNVPQRAGTFSTPQKVMSNTAERFGTVKSTGYGKAQQIGVTKAFPNPNNPYSGGMKF
jgi:hypothetical protein